MSRTILIVDDEAHLRTLIRQALEETGSKSKASEKLGIPRQSLQKMMKRLGMKDAGAE